MQNKTQQNLIADLLVIFVLYITDSNFLPDHIGTLSSITFSKGCACIWSQQTLIYTHILSIHDSFQGEVFQTSVCSSLSFLSIWGSTGQFDVSGLSHKPMYFSRIIWGRMVARVGCRLSPSKSLDLNSSHCNSGRLHGPDLQ